MHLRNGTNSLPNLKSRTQTFRVKKTRAKKPKPKPEEQSTDPDILTTWSQNNASSPFLRLPQEIKNIIYNLIIPAETLHIQARHAYYAGYFRNIICRAKIQYHRTGMRRGWTPEGQAEVREYDWNARHDGCTATGIHRRQAYDQCGPLKPDWKLPSLLLICREIYAETRLIPYRKHTFIFSQPTESMDFIRRLSPDQVAAVRNIQLGGLAEKVSDWEAVIEMMISRLRGVVTIELQTRSLLYNDEEIVNDFRRLGKLSLGSATLIVRQGWAQVASFTGKKAGASVTESDMWG